MAQMWSRNTPESGPNETRSLETLRGEAAELEGQHRALSAQVEPYYLLSLQVLEGP